MSTIPVQEEEQYKQTKKSFSIRLNIKISVCFTIVKPIILLFIGCICNEME
jgi:hypothetical protein